MRICLKLDFDGEPYLLLSADTKSGGVVQDIEGETLELFIKKAKQNGIMIKNEAGNESIRNDYASIRIMV